jgi:hypothetical protein
MRPLAPLALVLLGAIVAVAAYLQALNYPFIVHHKVKTTGFSRSALALLL